MGSSIHMSNSGMRISQRTSDIVKNNDANNANNIFTPTPFDANNIRMDKSITAHDKIIVCMIELENKMIATGSYDNTIKIWNLENPEETCEREIQENGKIFSLLEFEPNILITSIDYTPEEGIQDINQVKVEDIVIKCYDLNEREPKSLFSLTQHKLRVNCLVKCSDKFFASCSNDNDIIIWDYVKRAYCQTLSGHNDCVLSMIQLRNKNLCSGSADMTMRIWNWESGDCLSIITGNNHWIKCLCELDNGYIISGLQNNLIEIWNNKENINELRGHTRSVRSICQIGNTNYIASASFDHTIKIWDLDNSQCVKTLDKHTSSVINVIYHSNGYLISCSNDRTIKTWIIN
jgi:WD40 repeat protein